MALLVCVGCIGGPGQRQRVSRANGVRTVDMTAAKLYQYCILQAIGKKGHLCEHLKVASHWVWRGHVTYTNSIPVSRDTVPSGWPGLMPKSYTGVISHRRDTVCGGGRFLLRKISELVPSKHVDGCKGHKCLRCGRFCKRLLWLKAAASHHTVRNQVWTPFLPT